MNGTFTMKKIVAHPLLSLLCIVALLLVLPNFGSAAMMVGAAAFMSVYVAATPEQFRNRNGSLKTAISLVTAMWAAAALVGVLTTMG